jgi:general stress protein CsbA
MSMVTYAKSVAISLAVILNAGAILGEEPAEERQLVERIVASWRARQEKVKTIRARATIESFYSKGWVSSVDYQTGYGPIPPDDLWFKDQWYSWDIDVHQGRLRKERYRAEIYGVDESIAKVPPVIRRFYGLEFFTDGNSTVFQRPEDFELDGVPTRFRHHVSLYGHTGHEFVIGTEDLPLFWCAGGTITGDWPNPLNMLKVDEPDRFTFYGRIKYQQRDCVILRVRNQNSKISVAEFWIDESPPYLIYQRRIVDSWSDAEWVHHQIQVQYRDQQGYPVPSAWTISCYSYRDPFEKNDAFAKSKLFTHVQIYTVEKIEVNSPLARELFTPPPLKVGMGVDDAVRNQRYVVNYDGKLVPFRNPEQQLQLLSSSSRWWRTMRYVAAVAMTIVLVVAAWLGYRYSRKWTGICR